VARSQQPDGEPAQLAPPQPLADAAASQEQEQPARGRTAARVLAQVGIVPILEQEVREACMRDLMRILTNSSLSDSEKKLREEQVIQQTLEQFIDREVVLQEAMARLGKGPAARQLEKLKEAADKELDKQLREIKHDLEQRAGRPVSDDDVKNLLRLQGTSVESLRRQMQREMLYREYIRFNVLAATDRIGHEQILDYYRSHPEEFQTVDGVVWQDIFLSTQDGKFPNREAARQFAEELMERVRRGEDFAQLAAKHDVGLSRIRNGQGEGRRRGEIRPVEAEPILFGMKGGEVALMELSTGFHVLHLVKREHAGQLPFDTKVQRQIHDKLRSEVFQREAKQLVDTLRRRAAIERAPMK
jgi:hypothetical protein